MSFTFQNVLDRARVPLNDSDVDRYPDAELLTYAVDAYLRLRRYRPDIFIGTYSALPAFSSIVAGTTFPSADDSLLPAIADYVAARAETKDDENVIQQRAQAFYALFVADVRGAS